MHLFLPEPSILTWALLECDGGGGELALFFKTIVSDRDTHALCRDQEPHFVHI